MNQQHRNIAKRRPLPMRTRPVLALALACGMALVAASGHANTTAARGAHPAGHGMPEAEKRQASAPTTQAVAPSSGTNQYRRFTFDEPLADWRAVNDTVRTIGGWRAYLKEVQEAEAQQKAAPAPDNAGARAGSSPIKDKP